MGRRDEIAFKEWTLESYWQATASDRIKGDSTESLQQTYDVIIVGGGFAGISTAFHLLKLRSDLRVAVLEARFVGSGASGRNSGLLSPLPAPLWFLASVSDEVCAQTTRYLHSQVLGMYRYLLDIPAVEDVRQVQFCLEATDLLSKKAVKVASRLLDRLSIDHQLLRQQGIHRLFMESVAINPMNVISGMARACAAQGCQIIEGAVVNKVEASGSGEGASVTLANGTTIEAAAAVICSNAYTKEIDLPFRFRDQVVKEYLGITDERFSASDSEKNELFLVRLNKYFSYYRRYNDRRLFGGFEKTTLENDLSLEPVDPHQVRQLQAIMQQVLEQPEISFDSVWTGKYFGGDFTLPYIGNKSGTSSIIYNLRYGATGVALALILSRLAAYKVAGNVKMPLEIAALDMALRKSRWPIVHMARALFV